MKNKELTILIPALNEEDTVAIVIKKAIKWLEENKVDGEILVIDNGSKDKTKNIAEKNGAIVIQERKIGYGNAIHTGIENAKGKYIIMGDADDSYNMLEMTELYDKLKEGYDLVIGNRYYNIEKGAMNFWHRYLGTPILTKMINRKYKLKLNDINCGLRGFKTESIKKLEIKSDGMEFASEMIIKFAISKMKISEVGINFYKSKRIGKSHLKPIKDTIRHIKIIYSANN